jgi:integrase
MAKPYGKKVVYSVTSLSIESFLHKHFESLESKKSTKVFKKEHKDCFTGWIASMEKGTLTGKSYSQTTIRDYERNLRGFFCHYREVTPETLKKALMKIDPVHFCKREHLYKACLCFSVYLVKEGLMDASITEQVKSLAPKRHLPPKRNTVKEDELQKLYEACQSPQDIAIVSLLSSTGLRASEACSLNVSDIDLMEGVLTVQCGKGGKRRQVGLSPSAMAALSKQIESLPASSKTAPVFLDLNGKRMTPRGLHARLERIGKAVGVTANPHALRRAFVTINANKGRPLQMLQRACGHSDIKTTMSYCRTSEQEVIDAMKYW